MEIFKYLQPENPLAIGLVWTIIFLFTCWIIYLIYMWHSIDFQRKAIKRGEEIDEIADRLVLFLNKKGQSKKDSLKGNTDNDREEESKDGGEGNLDIEMSGDQFTERAFAEFSAERDIKENDIIGKHIKAIFEAGLHDSRLDVGELIKHTTSLLFRGNTLLKTLLGSFIVIGLLGTLLGLTDSLAALSPVLAKSNASEYSKDLTMGLSNLFLHLKTAFAPSIWGVGFTVIGILIFSFYLRTACYSAKNTLERATLTVWVPRLFLTTSQRLIDTLRVSEDQIQKNLKAIDGVVGMQELIKTDVDDLSKKLKSTNRALDSMTDSASGLRAFTDSFANAVNNLTSYQGEIRGLYDQMVQSSQVFQENVRQSALIQQHSLETFREQNDTLQGMFKSLKSYEGAYVEERKNIDLKMLQLVETAQQTYKALSDRNKDGIQEISKPITEHLQRIDDSLIVGLDAIDKRFGNFDSPIKKAAEQIEGSLETVVNRTEALTENMQREFFKFNDTIGANLTTLIKTIEIQSTRLTEGTKTQNEVSGIMKEKVTQLSDNIGSLNKSVESLNESSKAGESVLSQMGQLGDFGKKLGTLIETLDRGNKTQESQFRDLLRELEKNSKTQEKQMKDFSNEIGSMSKKVEKQMKKTSTVPWVGNKDFKSPSNPGEKTSEYNRKKPGEGINLQGADFSKMEERKHSIFDWPRSQVLNFLKRLLKIKKRP